MKNSILASVLLLAIPMCANAQEEPAAKEYGWSGSGEFGFAATSGNTKSENLNAKLGFAKEDEAWKYTFNLNALRSKGEIKNTFVDADGNLISVESYDQTANRIDGGASAAYKFNERSYLITAARYDQDEFSPYDYQFVLSVGYGYTVIKNEQTEFSAEIGPGYRRLDSRPYDVISGIPPVVTVVDPEAENNLVARGLIAYKHKFNKSTSFENVSLVEAGSNNTYLQNDAGLAVSMSDKLALKLGYQIRYNSEVTPGTEKTDQLITTNLLYKF